MVFESPGFSHSSRFPGSLIFHCFFAFRTFPRYAHVLTTKWFVSLFKCSCKANDFAEPRSFSYGVLFKFARFCQVCKILGIIWFRWFQRFLGIAEIFRKSKDFEKLIVSKNFWIVGFPGFPDNRKKNLLRLLSVTVLDTFSPSSFRLYHFLARSDSPSPSPPPSPLAPHPFLPLLPSASHLRKCCSQILWYCNGFDTLDRILNFGIRCQRVVKMLSNASVS